MIGLTHVIFAFSLIYILRLPIVAGIISSILPDLDLTFTFAFPLVHRGILHTPIALIVLTTLFYLITQNKSSTLAFAIGFLTHLFLDSLTPMGIMWLFPYEKYYSLNLVYSSSLLGNLMIILFSLLIFVLWKYHQRLIVWIKS